MIEKKLWDYLKLDESCTTLDAEKAYYSLPKTPNTKLAWKVLRDRYYADVYKTHQYLKLVEAAGFFIDN